jgi:hypothetical protein
MRKINPQSRQKNIEYLRKKRLSNGVVPLGTEIFCEECGLPLTKSASRKKLHTKCHDKRQNACTKRIQIARKIRVLMHYSKDGTLRCSWDKCLVSDPDMLCLDHVENDGHIDRKAGLKGSYALYQRLERAGFPTGFQTLCFNHNMKKRFLK